MIEVQRGGGGGGGGGGGELPNVILWQSSGRQS